MDLLRQSDLIKLILEEILYTVPDGWRKVVYYTERIQDVNIGTRRKSIAQCWLGLDMKPYNPFNGPPLKGSIELVEAVDLLYEESKSSWTGLGVVVNCKGKYSTRFYYENTPLLNNNSEEYNQILEDLYNSI